MKSKLKIGLLITDEYVPRWIYDAVNYILISDYCGLEVAILYQAQASSQKKGGSGNFIFAFHKWIDRHVFHGKNRYDERKNILDLIGNLKRINVDRGVNKESVLRNQDALTELRNINLDVIIKSGYGEASEFLSSYAKYGLWSYPMTDCDSEYSDTTGYYEVTEKRPLTFSGLYAILGYGQKPIMLTGVAESTCAYSVNLNREKLFRRASLFVPRILSGLFQFGPDHLQIISQRSELPELKSLLPLPPPSSFKSLGNLFIAATILLQQIMKKIVYSDSFTWTLLFNQGNDDDFETFSFRDFKKIKSPRDRFWADPFVVKRKDRYYVFVEEYIYKAKKGHISVLELDSDGRLVKTDKIIENQYHMSYPFVFEWKNVFYMIPETGGNRSIDLYKCTGFPLKWEFVKNIMRDINAVDTTLFHYDGKWWLFTLIDRIDSGLAVSPELYLFHAEDLFSDIWISHPMNPVVSDVRYSRPAGKVFIREGKIYRPSQDCSGRYGNSFDINQILTLATDRYEEIQTTKVRPDWDGSLKGTHTFNTEDDFTIIDAYKLRRRLYL